ncbi:integrase domain-containing protein [Geobacter pickeringii]|uniref:Core-binding (CB) domain-containing protein n=1 Tax=Geobacter pickeringii TaxID=345632 RepID=A0A0B5BAJ4_9BACT|nr:integrase domain-containing protein [Geobacter pickeringii]AJE03597.1 hypothetical protein GPICK_09750 [Geobacter pickeringii]
MGKRLERQALERIGKNWSKSSLTKEKLLSNVREFARFCESRYGLQRIDTLKPHMVESYLHSLHERGLAPSTMSGKLSAVREVAKAVGKANIVARDNSAYGVSRQGCRYNPQQANGAKLAEIRATLHTQAEGGDRVALMMRAADALRQQFGLRAKESLLTSKTIGRDGRTYLVVEGAKGGRPRELEVRTVGQQAAVRLVAGTAERLGNANHRLIPPELALKEAYDAQRNTWRALGGTRENGAHMHAERHAYAQARLGETGDRRTVAEELGHGRESVTAHYVHG